MYVLIQDTQRPFHYLGYNDTGELIWTPSRLDATRFGSYHEAIECKKAQNLEGCICVNVGLDGKVFIYKDYEIQIFERGDKWRYRVLRVADSQYCYSIHSVDTPAQALRYAKQVIKSEKN